MTLPLVSIITPTYNRVSYLDETIRSVLSQDYPRIEYIVLDDGSTDNTIQALEKYAGKLIYETHSNMGETRTVNKGWSMSHGEIVAVVNSDDPLLPGAVSAAVKFMESNTDIVVAYPDWDIIGPDSQVKKHVRAPEYNYLDMVRYHRCHVGPGAFIRRTSIELAGGRDPDIKYVADLEFWLRLGLYGKFARIPLTLATWRDHADSVSNSCKSVEMAEEHIILVQKYFSRSDLPKDIIKLKDDSMCWAYGVAAMACGFGIRLPLKYFYTAFTRYPVSFIKAVGHWHAWSAFVKAVFGSLLYGFRTRVN